MSQEDLSPGSDKTLAWYYLLTKMTHYVFLKPRWSNVADEKCLFPCYRAFARVGNAYFKKEDYNNALLYFNKSLSEHRDPEIVKKSQEVSILSPFHGALGIIYPSILRIHVAPSL